MRNRRQHLISWLGLSVAAYGASNLAQAAFPEKPIKLIVPSAAGGSPDVICRILAAELAKALGQSVIVDNKPGAGGAIGIQEIARSAPDGLTMGYGNVVTLAINQSLYSKLPYDADVQLAGVAHLGDVQNVLIINNALPIKNVAELITYAKSRPGKLSMGSAGNGTTGHLGGELFKALSAIFVTHVPYRGSPQAINDLIGGQIEMMFDNLTSALPHVKAGRVRALAVSGSKRSSLAPDLPTINEAGVKGYETTAWGGIVVPAGTPKDIVQKLNFEINKILALPPIIERYAQLGFEVNTGSSEKLFERARKERPQWAQIVKRSGAKVD
jgi:tripartite-type tricarboxylate transporter receptor subunit TctC